MFGDYIEISDCITSFKPIDIDATLRGNEDVAIASFEEAGVQASDVRNGLDHYTKWLPFAAEQYNISANIKDYVVVPITIMPSDLPNRNGVAFPFKELMKFNPTVGKLGFRTWDAKPTFADHVNQDWTVAKGVVLDTAMVIIPNSIGKLSKVVSLCAYDRARDAKLVNAILTGERTSYSMGARVQDYLCSICNSRRSKGGCDHVTHGKPEFKTYNGELAYLNVEGPIGFEISSVVVPAFQSAINKQIINMGT